MDDNERIRQNEIRPYTYTEKAYLEAWLMDNSLLPFAYQATVSICQIPG